MLNIFNVIIGIHQNSQAHPFMEQLQLGFSLAMNASISSTVRGKSPLKFSFPEAHISTSSSIRTWKFIELFYIIDRITPPVPRNAFSFSLTKYFESSGSANALSNSWNKWIAFNLCYQRTNRVDKIAARLNRNAHSLLKCSCSAQRFQPRLVGTGQCVLKLMSSDLSNWIPLLTPKYPPTSCTSNPIKWPSPWGMKTAPTLFSTISLTSPCSNPAAFKSSRITRSAKMCISVHRTPLDNNAFEWKIIFLPGLAAFSTVRLARRTAL